jgi:hypothetical protein
MIFLYTLILLMLAALRVVVARRATSLERRYSKVASAVLRRASEPAYKLGNSGKVDVGASAKRMLELALLVGKRDALESKCLTWGGRADKLSRAVSALRNWKGQKLPYTLGAIDVWLVLYVIDRFGAGDMFGPRQAVDNLVAWLGW